MAKDLTYFKNCPHCVTSFGTEVRNEFVKAQFLDYLFCPNCNGKSFIVVPDEKKIMFRLTQILVFTFVLIVLFVMAAGLIVLLGDSLFQGGVEQEYSRVRRSDIITGSAPLLITGGMVLGVILMMKRFLSRLIMWQFARVQKTPYSDGE